jgi:hypothetical protein
MLRAAAPSGDWSVEERRAQLVLLEPESRADERDGGEEMSSDDVRLKPCEHCQSEGRIIRSVSRHWGLEPKEEDCGECPVCKGTGMEMIEVESIDLDDLCRNGGCQYGMAPEHTCRHECQYKRADSKQETVSDERDGAVAERSAARSEHISPERRRGLEEAIRIIEKMRDDYIREHCQTFNDGHWVGTNAQQEHVSTLDDIIGDISRALIPPSSEGGSPR